MNPWLAFILAFCSGIASLEIPHSSLQAASARTLQAKPNKQAQEIVRMSPSASWGDALAANWFITDWFDRKPTSNALLSRAKEDPKSRTTNPSHLELLNEMESQTISVLDRSSAAVVYLEGGTGVIVSPQGYVLTASHVARTPGSQIRVHLSNGVSWVGVTLVSNRDNDTAIVKLLGERRWPHIPIGDSREIQQGQWVLCMGYPLSFRSGRPAAMRLGRIRENATERLVADCVIMGGDSGGPLMDLAGNVVGISSSIKKKINENYFIPINVFKNQWQDLLDDAAVDSAAKKTIDFLQTQQATHSGLGELDTSYNKRSFEQIFESLNHRHAASLVRVSDGTSSVAGTIVSEDGLVVAKASEVKRFNPKKPITISIASQILRCRIVGERASSDLVLLEWIEESSDNLLRNEFQAIAFSEEPSRPFAGRFVFSLTESGSRPLGIVSVNDQTFVMSSLPMQTDLGLIVRQLKYFSFRDPNGNRKTHPAIEIDRVYPGSLADSAQLKVGDFLLTVDGQTIQSQRALTEATVNSFAGQSLKLKLVSNGKVENRLITVPPKGPPNIFDRWGGGPFSKLRFGFDNVICHDGIIEPDDCGGPLCDLQGKVIGINIARATRVSTFAIPLSVVESFILKHRPNANLVRH